MTRIIFKDAQLLDGDNGPRRANVIVSGSLIEAVTEGPISPLPEDRVVELNGRTLMPGMVHSHYHAAYWNTGSTGKPLGLEVSPAQSAIRAATNVRLALDCGFTGLIGAGAPFAIDAALKAAIAEGMLVGPRIMAGSRDVSSTGHSADMSYPSYWEIGAKGAVISCNGPEEFRRAVRQEAKDGSEIIKVFATGGHGTQGSGSDWVISREEFEMAVRTADERNIKVRAHIANREAILFALDIGVHLIDHGDGFDDECIDRIIEKGAFLTPSLYFPKRMMTIAPGTPYTDAMKPDYDAMAEILPRANKAGVKLLIGDDHGSKGVDHGCYAEELALYVNEIGIPALDVIRWATKHGAEAMGLGDVAGTIEPGRYADLVVVDGDPIADITVLQDRDRLLGIFKEGEAVKDQLHTIVGAS
jgi:imidazolonepropionase-like amidohydrolase